MSSVRSPHSSRTVLVTGGAGHVGSHVCELLVQDPATRVISLDNYFTGSPANHVAGVEYRRGPTSDIGALVPETPAIVYHLGEYSRVAPSFEDIALVHEFNGRGTAAVAEFCRRRGVGKLVYAASSTKFAREGDGRHQSPYALSKAANVDLITNYGRWYDLPHAICYFYNGFGPRETRSGPYATLIARFEEAYLRGVPLPIVRPGTQRRAFTYVTDLARGMLLVGAKGCGDGYALGARTTYSVEEIAAAFGGPVTYIDGNPGRCEATNDTSKADALGWAPTVDVIEYIRAFTAAHPHSPVTPHHHVASAPGTAGYTAAQPLRHL